MTTFQTIASSSSGNASLLTCGDVRLLIDMGVSCRRLCQALASLGLAPGDLTAVLITHEHTDHVSGLATYIKKYATPIVCSPGTARQLCYRLAGVAPLLRPVEWGESIRFGPVEATPLPTSHDCRQGTAYRLATPGGAVGILTDTGYIIEETGRRLLGADLLVLESNHDPDLLRAGPYPYPLKKRILGSQGHLSNAEAAQYAAASARAGTRTILLAHLSQENNRPQLALEAASAALEGTGWTGQLAVAPRAALSEPYFLEEPPCRE